MFHTLGTIHGKGNILIGLGIELARVALGEQLGKTRNGAQRFPEIVRGNVGELFQLRVRPGQFCGGVLELLL